ncbi:MAG: 3-isopropylmalate dehydratase small subunit [Cyanobacteria bacterium]|nr:3-isopropylmalate dehydratase small subunit [Cyanobacteria bacterium bin.275]
MTSTPFPMGPIQALRGRAVVVAGDDIDTDRIIPARFLKCITFEGLGSQVFADDRAERPASHPFDHPAAQGASLLVVNRNFGCGSSREHAPQALMRWGIRAVVGESFAEIFYGNCLALGIPCFTAPHDGVLSLQAALAAIPTLQLVVCLDSLRLEAADGQSWQLELQPGPRQMLLSGQWDATSQLLSNGADLDRLVGALPYLNGF